MDIERRIASAPVRSTTETSDRLLELAGAWGGNEKVTDLSPAAPILQALILDRILQRTPLTVEYGSHTLSIFLEYEDEALSIRPDDEDLPLRLPHPVGDDVSWKLVAPCPDRLRAWTTSQAGTTGISKWFVVAGPDGKKQTPHTDNAPAGRGGAIEINAAAIQRLIDREKTR